MEELEIEVKALVRVTLSEALYVVKDESLFSRQWGASEGFPIGMMFRMVVMEGDGVGVVVGMIEGAIGILVGKWEDS